MTITLTINQSEVLQDAVQTAEYIASKKVDSPDVYERIRLVDENVAELERFWKESQAEAAGKLADIFVGDSMSENHYTLTLEVSELFDNVLIDEMTRSLYSYFESNIVGKWLLYTSKDDSTLYLQQSVAWLEEVRTIAYTKNKPTRPSYN